MLVCIILTINFLWLGHSTTYLGFQRKLLVQSLYTNIEGREWRRRHATERSNRPEHPRASTSDDVECLFSIMRDAIGLNFTAKQVKLGLRKVLTKFSKRLDPDLPFYYHTSSHMWYSEGPLPSFSEPSKKKRKKARRVPRREQPIAFMLRCATLPVHAIRTQYHTHPIALPPPPTVPPQMYKHSYHSKWCLF